MQQKIICLFILGVLTFSACREKPVYSSTPAITYQDFTKFGKPSDPDSVVLVIYFTDNEGDIGLAKQDTLDFFKSGNLWMTYFYDSMGRWAAWDTSAGINTKFDTFKIAYRIPPLLPKGDPSEPMKGLIYVMQSPFIKVHDTIMYSVTLYDKALHKSDTIHTPSIIFK